MEIGPTGKFAAREQVVVSARAPVPVGRREGEGEAESQRQRQKKEERKREKSAFLLGWSALLEADSRWLT